MAQGTIVLFETFAKNAFLGGIGDISSVANSIMVSPITNERVPTASDDRWNYVTASANNAIHRRLVNPRLVTSGGKTTFTADPLYWPVDPPIEKIWYLILSSYTYNAYVADVVLIGFMDVTPDGGTTPWDVGVTPLTVTWNASGVFDCQVLDG